MEDSYGFLLFVSSAVCAVSYLKTAPAKPSLQQQLQDGTSLNAHERICLVTTDNIPLPLGGLRKDMRLHNLWHRATYILIKHEAEHVEQHEDCYVLVQRRSSQKDYCPGKLDPTPGGVVGHEETYLENAVREIAEEMGIDCSVESKHQLIRLFTFSYEDEQVRVWGEFFELTYHGALKDLCVQEDEVDAVLRMSLDELYHRVDRQPDDFMPDACHAMRLFRQLQEDFKVNRRFLKGYSSLDLDSYGIRPKPEAIFFDCDDCLYFDNWGVANLLTAKIDAWCVDHGLQPGQAYGLYKQYGTALRGLLAEGYLQNERAAIDAFLQDVHDIPIHQLIRPDKELRLILQAIDPSIPVYIFTASVDDHARRCLQALGIEDLFVDIIDCKKVDFETKHSRHSFQTAMEVAGVKDPERCLFFDDNMTNIQAAREIGWRSVLVGRIGRDNGLPISSEHAELELDRIHDIRESLPELFSRLC
jgi:pyrimidine 5'-nucleotidase